MKAMRMGPVSEPGPSISCMEDLTAHISVDGTTPIKQERSLLQDWLVAREETPEVGCSFVPERERRGVQCNQSIIATISIDYLTI
jgi:hypothetical protein